MLVTFISTPRAAKNAPRRKVRSSATPQQVIKNAHRRKVRSSATPQQVAKNAPRRKMRISATSPITDNASTTSENNRQIRETDIGQLFVAKNTPRKKVSVYGHGIRECDLFRNAFRCQIMEAFYDV